MKNSFFKTRAGELSISVIISLLSLPVMVAGANGGSAVTSGLGFAMVFCGLLYAPFSAYVIHK